MLCILKDPFVSFLKPFSTFYLLKFSVKFSILITMFFNMKQIYWTLLRIFTSYFVCVVLTMAWPPKLSDQNIGWEGVTLGGGHCAPLYRDVSTCHNHLILPLSVIKQRECSTFLPPNPKKVFDCKIMSKIF